jgi:D-alanyl-D-alanine carboxypeptidase/D-alanyl-D-alanine-endopeptidase (penicillin-binding protein 4)
MGSSINRLLFLAVALTAAVHAAEKNHAAVLQGTVETLLKSSKCSQSSIGIMVRNLQRDTTLVAVSADSMFNPASVTKLLTAAVAFETLGQSYCFTTRVFTDTVLNRDSALTVRDLYIQGGGDPTITVERLWLLAENLRHRGVRKVAGNLVLDDFLFDSVTIGPGLDEDTTSRAYQPLINALAMNFNTVAVYHRPGPFLKRPVVFGLFPEIKGLKVDGMATTVPAGRHDELDIASLPDSAGATRLTIAGVMGLDEPCGYTYRKLWRTWEAFGNALIPMLQNRGIAVTGKIIHDRVPRRIANRTPLLEFPSEPLSVPVSSMFKYSSNFTAEMLFKSLSARRDTTAGSWTRSSAAVLAWWKDRGLPGTPVIKNGSGMGNTNRISAAQIVALLSYVWKQKNYCPEYVAALSTAGTDGTVKSRFQKSRLKGLVRAKTGTLNSYGISTLAGYILTADKGPYAFAVLCSKTGRTQFDDWSLQEQILEKVADLELK